MKSWVLLIVVLLTFHFSGCGQGDTSRGGSGFIEANDVIVSAETAGRIETRFFDDGSLVKAGDTLAIIDPSRLQLELASAQAIRNTSMANLETARLQVQRTKETEKYARSERDRISRLLTSGSATQKQMDQLEYELTQAVNAYRTAMANVVVIETQIQKTDADIDRLKRQLKDCYPTSPLSGVVVEKYVEPGEVVSQGKAIAKIANLDTVWVKVYLSAGDFSTVKQGDRATVSTESGETKYEGRVIWTSAEAEFTPKNVETAKSRANLVYAVKVQIVNREGYLKIGMPVFVSLESR